MNSERLDRLYELLPAIYRQLDEDHDQQLRDFLRVIAEQVNAVEDDIARLYDNWFIETCDEWAIPYIGDLIGFEPATATAAGSLGRGATDEERRRNRILAPRRELANTLRNRARRGTLSLLELLAADSAGQPARAVEFFEQLVAAQSLNFIQHGRARTVDLRDVEALDLLDGPFDTLAHGVDLRRSTSSLTQGKHNIPTAGAFVWRLRAYPITRATAYARQTGEVQFTFSPLGNNAPLFTNAARELDPGTIASELELPVPIRRRALAQNVEAYYGPGKSFAIWRDEPGALVPAAEILPADLTDWTYSIPPGRVAVDPVLGRIAFADDRLPERQVWVSYHYGFTAELGGGEYRRPLAQADGAAFYRVSRAGPLATLGAAILKWKADKHRRAVIEIADSDTYVESIDVRIGPKQYLQIRAANGCRPVFGLVDWDAGAPEVARIRMSEGSRFVLDGIVLAGRPLQIRSGDKDDVRARVAIRHCTLVPGWSLLEDCRPRAGGRPSLELERITGRVTIDRSILGSIEIDSRRPGDPLRLELHDSIVDATSDAYPAIAGRKNGYANAALRIARCTIVGETRAHSLSLAENAIFTGAILIVRRQEGCVRFCHVPAHSRTPRRHRCQPDLVEEPLRAGNASGADHDAARERVRPRFDSLRYGTSEYARLALDCPREISRGADDDSEMGVFHDVFAPQRAANLRVRLDEYTPSSMDTGIFYGD